MGRLDKERQAELEPKRMDYAKKCISDLGLEITIDINIEHKTFLSLFTKVVLLGFILIADGQLAKQLKMVGG